MIRFTGAVLALVLTGCTLPVAPSSPGSSPAMRLQFSPPAGRTVVPALAVWLAQVDGLTIDLTRTDAAAAPLSYPFSGAGITSGALSLTNVPPGTWTVAVTALKTGTPVGSGQATGVVVTANSTANVGIALAPSLTTGTGDLSLSVSFPDSAGVSAVSAVLSRRNDATPVALNLGAFSQVASSNPPLTQVLLTSPALAAGAYDLDVKFTEPTGTRTYRQAVNIYQNLTADQTVGVGGTVMAGWSLGNEYFGSSTFLAGIGYSFAGGTFSSPTRDYTFFTGDTTFHLTAQPAYTGQTVEYYDSGATSWTLLSAGQNSPDWPVPSTATLRVTSPGGARGYYTVAVGGLGDGQLSALASEPTIEFTTELAGQKTWSFDANLAVTATSPTPGTWAWLFDGQVVLGQNAPVFTAVAGSLSTVPGAHVLTALFTARGATWARQTTVFLTDVVGDVRLSIQAQKTEVHVSGGDPIAFGNGGLAVTVDDQDVDQLVFGVDDVANPTSVTTVYGASTPFVVPTTGLPYGLHTLYVQVKFHDGRLAAAMVPFWVKPLGGVAGMFELAAPARFHPIVTTKDFAGTFYTLQDLEFTTAVELGVTLPALPTGYAASASLLRVTFNGQVQEIAPSGSPILLSYPRSSLTPGMYALTLELWGGPTEAERRSLGSQTIMITATAGGNT